MMRILALLLAVLSLSAQRPPDESNLPDSEKRIPPGHFCQQSAVYDYNQQHGRRSAQAHPCSCQYACSMDADGNVTEHEAPSCLAFCHVNGRHCTCWPEGDPKVVCDKPAGTGLVDMDGNVIAVARRR